MKSSLALFHRQLTAHIDTLRRAASDVDIRGAPLSVYLYLNHELDSDEFRPVKVAVLATELHIKPVTAAWALRRLVKSGYIEPGKKVDRLRLYRLKWDPPPTEKAG